MKNIPLLLFSILLSAQPLDKDLAYRMVSDNLQGSHIPDAFVREAFTHSDIQIHTEIAERFARPYEKKTWEVYRKIFVKKLQNMKKKWWFDCKLILKFYLFMNL